MTKASARVPLQAHDAGILHLCRGLARAATVFTHGGVPMAIDTPQLSAILRSLAERLSSLEDAVNARSAPAGEIRQALNDILKIYGVTGMTGEVVTAQREQIQALAEAMTRFHARSIEHDRRAMAERKEIRELLEQLRACQREQPA